MYTWLDGGVCDTEGVQTVSHVLQTGGPGFNYTYQQQVDILISKNQALQILYIKHHVNVYKT